MDLNFVVTRSLPPLVEGKIHGYLKCIIDEVVWTRQNFGNVNIIASWWGELDNAAFKLVDIKTGIFKNHKEITETYAINTNLELFKEYLKNSETVELTIIGEKSHDIIGKAHITDLLQIFTSKSYLQYFPIYNKYECKIGDVHVTLKLLTIQKNTENSFKSDTLRERQINSKKLLAKIPTTNPNIFFSNTKFNVGNPFIYENMPLCDKDIEQNGNIYQSILRNKHDKFYNPTSKINSGITDKLVAQIVARAKKLRGEMSNDTNDNDSIIFNENSSLSSIDSEVTAENEAALYEYFMGKKMTRQNEKKTLKILRSHSPTSSLIDFAAETIRNCNKNILMSSIKCVNSRDNLIEEFSDKSPIITDRISIKNKQASPIDYVDSLRIIVDSLTLNSAGYRHAKSSYFARTDEIPISVTYFVQYDANFGHGKKLNKKIVNGCKPVKMCSKKQNGENIYFNHEAIYDLSKTYLKMDIPLKFKIFNRHLNQRTPTELGIGSFYISDVEKTPYLSSIQRLAIIKKDIKIGELKVTIELGCDKIHFGKEFLQAVTSTKENIPVIELSPNSINLSNRYKSTTSGDESKTNSKTTSVPEKQCDNSWSVKNSIVNERKMNEQKQHNNRQIIGIDIPSCSQDKILLHALIYIGEGRNLSVSNTYLISRAFWREDRAVSRICTESNNPFYHFHQLIPLIHDQELLNRTKDNCIITEVYSTNPTGDDHLLGIAKLSVHQLYIAYKDPLTLSHLLKSKYPIMSVDDWISIINPVTGTICGELSALVALGTADQIALLEMTRGLRDSSRIDIRNSVYSYKNLSIDRENFLINSKTEQIIDSHGLAENFDNVKLPNMKTQEYQTKVSNVHELKSQQSNENTVFNSIVDGLTHALHIPRIIENQSGQTENVSSTCDKQDKTNKLCNIEPLYFNASNSNSFSGDSYNNSPRDNFNMSREIFRSVGVGAEFNEPVTQKPNTYFGTQLNKPNITETFSNVQYDNSTLHLKNITRRDNSLESKNKSQLLSIDQHHIEMNFNQDIETSFRAIVEIECALHLPKIIKADDSVEPSTYVTFQKFCNNTTDRTGAYMMTNIFPYSCNPKYDWRCDTKLSIDLLIKEEKRLIMKVWRTIEPDVTMKINLEKDIIIGFSAIDLSVLTAGFPIISGWFHITDFTGKCNGQLKVCVTPLDNLTIFGKFNAPISQSKIDLVTHTDNSSLYPKDIQKNYEKQENININENNSEEIINIDGQQIDNEPIIDMGLGLGNASMSFLSLSLKQKLSELDEIKKRLQSRLQDVTNTAFDDDFENDCDLVEHDFESDNNDKNGNNDDNKLMESVSWLQQPIDHNLISNRSKNDNNCLNSKKNDLLRACDDDKTMKMKTVTTDTGYSTSSNLLSDQTLLNGINHAKKEHDNQMNVIKSNREIVNSTNTDITYNLNHGHANPHNSRKNICNHKLDELNTWHKQHSNSSVTVIDNHNASKNTPVQGTRVHINHLLDKLSTQLTAAPPPITNLPMKRNIMDLISSLRRNNNNFSNDIKCNREANVRTVPTQTDVNYVNDSLSQNNSIEHINNTSLRNDEIIKNDGEIPTKSQKREKISIVIRDELIVDDHNDTINYDYLSARLMTSNVRHMSLGNALNPLLYSHILPEISVSSNESQNDEQLNSTISSISPEGEVVEKLDNRYIETFNALTNKNIGKLKNTTDIESVSSNNILHEIPATLDNSEIFRVTPAGISENIDGNIDITVIHKPCNDELMASNSIEPTTIISIDNDMQTINEIDDNNSLNYSNTSVSVVSRQAPDGGNPAENTGKLFTSKQKNNSQNSLASDS